jgi:hypothetical protein
MDGESLLPGRIPLLISPTQSISPPIHTTAGVPPSPEPGTAPNPETPAVGTRIGQERSNLADPEVACHLLAHPTGFVPFWKTLAH